MTWEEKYLTTRARILALKQQLRAGGEPTTAQLLHALEYILEEITSVPGVALVIGVMLHRDQPSPAAAAAAARPRRNAKRTSTGTARGGTVVSSPAKSW